MLATDKEFHVSTGHGQRVSPGHGLREPAIFRALMQPFAAMWFGISLMAASLVLSIVTSVAYGGAPTWRNRPLPRYPKRQRRPSPTLTLGGSHHHTTPGGAPQPIWLTVPKRGLYTGVMISCTSTSSTIRNGAVFERHMRVLASRYATCMLMEVDLLT